MKHEACVKKDKLLQLHTLLHTLNPMNLRFDTTLARKYKSKSQIARVLTEDWLARNMYCPIYGEFSIKRAEANAPIKDFVCNKCESQYELKSTQRNSDSYDKKSMMGATAP